MFFSFNFASRYRKDIKFSCELSWTRWSEMCPMLSCSCFGAAFLRYPSTWSMKQYQVTAISSNLLALSFWSNLDKEPISVSWEVGREMILLFTATGGWLERCSCLVTVATWFIDSLSNKFPEELLNEQLLRDILDM